MENRCWSKIVINVKMPFTRFDPSSQMTMKRSLPLNSKSDLYLLIMRFEVPKRSNMLTMTSSKVIWYTKEIGWGLGIGRHWNKRIQSLFFYHHHHILITLTPDQKDHRAGDMTTLLNKMTAQYIVTLTPWHRTLWQ